MEISKKTDLNDLVKTGTVLEFFSAYQELDINRMLGLCDQHGEVTFEPLGDAGKGKINELGKNLWLGLMDSFPDLDNTVISSEADNQGNIIAKVNIHGTQEKDFANIPSKNLRFGSDHIFIFHFNEQGLIDKININWDHSSFCSQLGLEV
ncbi:hypothetical protein BH23BAC1_BH23BAC1_31310 [soil metagenome]